MPCVDPSPLAAAGSWLWEAALLPAHGSVWASVTCDEFFYA